MATVNLPKTDLDAMKAEDSFNDKLSGVPYRFGANIEVDLDINNSGAWTELENGDGVWRLAVRSKGAKSLNFVFDTYQIPEGAKVFVFTPDKSKLLGSFTSENASKIGSLGVGLVLSDELIIEYHEPSTHRGEGYLHIDNFTHGYRDILVEVEDEAKGVFGNSGACNINVNCPEGLPFDIQKRSVALIVVNNNAVCSGAMINNVLQDGTPFFLTARHCTPGNPNSVGNWIFYFNHETSGCSGNNGPTDQSVSGSTLLSRNQESDFALLELDDVPPPSFNVCYSGWDATDNLSSVTSAYGIHHPSGDVKKICFEDDAPYHQNLGTFVNQTWFIDEWEEGVTEGGSSGSPLFDQNGFIIGQLAGGAAACAGSVNNGEFDYYGRMGVSWTFGSTPANAIRFWLDPGNTGTLVVPNSCNSSAVENNASLGGFTGVQDAICNVDPFTAGINVFNLGSNTLTSIELEVISNGSSSTVDWSGSIDFGESAFISLGSISPQDGSNTLSVEIISVNDTDDQDDAGNFASRDYMAFANPVNATVNIDLDNYPEETTWTITDDADNELYAGGPYTDEDDPVSVDVCLGQGCYFFTIFDSFNDGICCGFGLGSYEVVDQSGNILASGGDFGSSEETEICLILSTDNEENSTFSVYPNPANERVLIDSGSEIVERIDLFDIRGRLVRSYRNPGVGIVKIGLSDVESGVYILQTKTNNRTAQDKLVIER